MCSNGVMHPFPESRRVRPYRLAWPRLAGIGAAFIGSAAFWIWLAEVVISRSGR